MKKQIIICLSVLLTASSCSMLELDESTGMSKDEVYGYFKNVKDWLRMYTASCLMILEHSTVP